MYGKKGSIVYWHGSSLYINLTNRCSNRCYFCFRNFTDGVWGFNLKLQREPSENEIIRSLAEHINRRFWREVVFCGLGEPTMRLNCVLEVAKWVHRNHAIPLRLETNGQAYLLNPNREVVTELVDAHIERVNVSLNAPNKELYNLICRPIFSNAYESVIDFIKKAKEKMEVEVTAVSVPQVNIEEVETLAEELGVKFRLREYESPVPYRL